MGDSYVSPDMTDFSTSDETGYSGYSGYDAVNVDAVSPAATLPDNPVDVSTLTDPTPQVFTQTEMTPGYSQAEVNTYGYGLTDQTTIPGFWDQPPNNISGGNTGGQSAGSGAGQTSGAKSGRAPAPITVRLPVPVASNPRGVQTVQSRYPVGSPGQTFPNPVGASTSGLGLLVIAAVAGGILFLSGKV